MTPDATSLDWSLVHSFLAVAETGSLSAAARTLGLSQPTLGRQIRAMEDAIGVPLFARHPRGFTLTETGLALLPGAEAMRAAARQIDLAAAGRDQRDAGTVRLTASSYVSAYILPPMLARLRAMHPEIQIELVPTDSTENLLFHEADLALRMYRPEQLDVITRHIGALPLGLYATPGYLAVHGTPTGFADLMNHQVVGYDRDDRMVRGFRSAGLEVNRDWFPVRCDDQVVNWALVCAGCGIGIGQILVGDADPRLRRILPDAPLPALPVWLTAHEAMRRVPRVARVWEALASAFAQVVS